MVRAETEQEVLTLGATHACGVHGMCEVPDAFARIKPHVKTFIKGRGKKPSVPFFN